MLASDRLQADRIATGGKNAHTVVREYGRDGHDVPVASSCAADKLQPSVSVAWLVGVFPFRFSTRLLRFDLDTQESRALCFLIIRRSSSHRGQRDLNLGSYFPGPASLDTGSGYWISSLKHQKLRLSNFRNVAWREEAQKPPGT